MKSDILRSGSDDDADPTITINRSDLVFTMMGAVSFEELNSSGKAKFVGDREVYERIKSMLVHFDLGFDHYCPK